MPAKEEDYWNLRLEIVNLKKDQERTNENLEDVKEELHSLKKWISNGVWVIASGILLSFTKFILEGGLNGIIK